MLNSEQIRKHSPLKSNFLKNGDKSQRMIEKQLGVNSVIKYKIICNVMDELYKRVDLVWKCSIGVAVNLEFS